jgi:peroxiredoxin Q/BCP
VSLDSPEKNAEFAASLKTQIPVVSDPKGETAERYGVIGFGGLYSKRWTFYIDKAGTLREIDKDVTPESAGQDILATLARLDFDKRSSREVGDQNAPASAASVAEPLAGQQEGGHR